MTARLSLIMGLLIALAARPAGAGPWSIEPRLGVEDDYTTNPILSDPSMPGEERVAAIYDLPLRYDTDELDFMLRPNGRYGDRQGYSSLSSNYEHLDASVNFSDELDTASVQEQIARDSSLYFLGGLANRNGVARDSESTGGTLARAINERSNIEMDGSWSEVRYDAPPEFRNVLLDYRYWSAGPTCSYALSERDTVKLLGTYGDYQSLNRITSSKSESLQLAFTRQLTEVWTLSLSAGYSRSMDSEKIYLFGFYFLGTQSSNQDSGVYTASLARTGERFNFTASISRSEQPTGFAYLSRQDSVNITATYIRSDRWDFGVNALWVKALTPQENAGSSTPVIADISQQYLNVKIAANWHWTPQWVVSASATEISQRYGPPTVSAASTNVSLSIVRRFLRISL